jgi:hypothetical protein
MMAHTLWFALHGRGSAAACGKPFPNSATTSRRGSTLTGADPTVELLRRHWADCTARLAVLSPRVTGRTRLYSAEPDMGRPREPASLISPDITVVDQLAPVKSTVD